jgi:hypothetical protein
MIKAITMKYDIRPKHLWIFAIIAGCVVLSFGQSPPKKDDLYPRFKSIIEQKVDSLGTNNLDGPAVRAIYSAGQDYLAKLPISEEKKREFLLSHLERELIELQKEELRIKIMVTELSQKEVKPEQFQIFVPFLSQQHLGNVDHALLACMVKSEIGGNSIFSQPRWKPILLSYLEKDNGFISTLASYLLSRTKREDWKFEEGRILPKWSAEEQLEVGRAVSATQERILAKRYLQEK